MLRGAFVIMIVAALGLGACGGGASDKSGSPQGPVSAGERAAVSELRFCVEGAGAKTAKPGVSIPELGEAPAGPDVPGARRALVIYWPATKDSAQAYYADDQAVAEAAARKLGSDVRRKDRLVVIPDADHPPTPGDEGLLLDDCLL